MFFFWGGGLNSVGLARFGVTPAVSLLPAVRGSGGVIETLKRPTGDRPAGPGAEPGPGPFFMQGIKWEGTQLAAPIPLVSLTQNAPQTSLGLYTLEFPLFEPSAGPFFCPQP